MFAHAPKTENKSHTDFFFFWEGDCMKVMKGFLL